MTPDFLANVIKLRVECCSSHQGQTHRIKSFQHNSLTLLLHTPIDVKYSIISSGNSVIKACWFVCLRSLNISLFAVLAAAFMSNPKNLRNRLSLLEHRFVCLHGLNSDIESQVSLNAKLTLFSNDTKHQRYKKKKTCYRNPFLRYFSSDWKQQEIKNIISFFFSLFATRNKAGDVHSLVNQIFSPQTGMKTVRISSGLTLTNVETQSWTVVIGLAAFSP